MRVEYLKWPDRPHYTAEMARLAGDGAAVWGGIQRGDRVVHGNGDIHTARVSTALAQRAFPFDGSEEPIWTLNH